PLVNQILVLFRKGSVIRNRSNRNRNTYCCMGTQNVNGCLCRFCRGLARPCFRNLCGPRVRRSTAHTL
ncbi:hypothetical protein C0991_001599, partial [Blastosporella zonata]